MDLTEITPLILTFNESANIDRTLQQLSWATKIVVIDSFSTDHTLEILSVYPQVQVWQRAFDTHAAQWNYGLDQIQSEWVLTLDADYVITDNLLSEISQQVTDSQIDGYFIPFKYCVFGKPLRGTLLPPRISLFRKGIASYLDDGHTQLLQINGATDTLTHFIHHDDRKSLGRWLWAQDRYMVMEVKKLLELPIAQLSWGDRIRRTKILAPFIILIYCLIFKAGIFDGWAGWYYAFQRMLAELLLSIRLIEAEKTYE